MKLIVTDISYAEKHTEELRRSRLTGSMVALYSERNRMSLMRTYYSLANYFIADGGEFVFSGCFSLYKKRSQYLEKTKEILDSHGVSYSFVTEVENACGGQILYACSGEKISNDRYNYTVSFSDEAQRAAVLNELEGICALKQEGEDTYLIFSDISFHEALGALISSENIQEDQIIFHMENGSPNSMGDLEKSIGDNYRGHV